MAAARPAAAGAATATAVLVLLLVAASRGQQQDEVGARGITCSHIKILELAATSRDN
jgi:hypothetical protein